MVSADYKIVYETSRQPLIFGKETYDAFGELSSDEVITETQAL